MAQTVNDDASAFNQALATVTATCPVPKVTLQTMKDARRHARVDPGQQRRPARPRDIGAAAEPAGGGELAEGLARGLERCPKTIIRKFIDTGDVSGFEGSGGLGSPIDNAINESKSALGKLKVAALLSDGG